MGPRRLNKATTIGEIKEEPSMTDLERLGLAMDRSRDNRCATRAHRCRHQARQRAACEALNEGGLRRLGPVATNPSTWLLGEHAPAHRESPRRAGNETA